MASPSREHGSRVFTTGWNERGNSIKNWSPTTFNLPCGPSKMRSASESPQGLVGESIRGQGTSDMRDKHLMPLLAWLCRVAIFLLKRSVRADDLLAEAPEHMHTLRATGYVSDDETIDALADSGKV